MTMCQVCITMYIPHSHSVSRLLNRLEFLFELPGRLTKSIEMEAYSTAVKYWHISDAILKRYSHMASFEKVWG